MSNVFEDEVTRSIEYLEGREDLLGEKIREKVPFGRRVSYGRSKFDFWILIGATFYAVECKMQNGVKTFSFSKNIIGPTEINTLISVERHGGTGVIAARAKVEKTPEVFLMKIGPFLRFLRKMKRASIPVEALRYLSFSLPLHRIEGEEKILWDFSNIEALDYALPEDPCENDFQMCKKGNLEKPFPEIDLGRLP